MEHLRLVVPRDRSDAVLDLLLKSESVCNVARFEGAVRAPEGDLVLCDVAKEDTSVLVEDLKGPRHRRGRLDRPRAGRHAALARCRAGGAPCRGGGIRRRRVGAGRGAQLGERRALRRLRGLHGPRRSDRGRRRPPRLPDPRGRRDGGRPRVRSHRRNLRCPDPAALGSRPPVARCPRGRFPLAVGVVFAATLAFRAAGVMSTTSTSTTTSSPASSRAQTSSPSSSRSAPASPGCSRSRPPSPAR